MVVGVIIYHMAKESIDGLMDNLMKDKSLMARSMALGNIYGKTLATTKEIGFWIR